MRWKLESAQRRQNHWMASISSAQGESGIGFAISLPSEEDLPGFLPSPGGIGQPYSVKNNGIFFFAISS